MLGFQVLIYFVYKQNFLLLYMHAIYYVSIYYTNQKVVYITNQNLQIFSYR